MDADKLRDYIERSCKKSGVPVKLADKSALMTIARLLGRRPGS